MQELADLSLVSRKTLARVENGDASVSLGVVASVLQALHLEDGLKELAKPETDGMGIFLESNSRPKRVRSKSKPSTDNEDDFDF